MSELSSEPPSLGDRLRTPGGAISVALVILLVVYSVLIVQQLLLIVWPLVTLAFLWLAYRFVRAHERIAAAQERATAGERGSAPIDVPDDGGGVGDVGGDPDDDRE